MDVGIGHIKVILTFEVPVEMEQVVYCLEFYFFNHLKVMQQPKENGPKNVNLLCLAVQMMTEKKYIGCPREIKPLTS